MKFKHFGIIIIALVLLLVIVTVGMNILGCISAREAGTSSEPEADETQQEDQPTISVYGESIPVDTTVSTNDYDTSLFSYDNGKITYNSDAAQNGIDISAFQGDIDWAQVADSGIDFAIIRLGYRGYGSGSLNKDELFEKNITGALDAGLDVGVYFFSQAINVEEAQEEAEYVIENIKDYDVTYPIVFDWEYITDDTARTDELLSAEITDCAVAFCKAVEEAGYTPCIYFNIDLGYTEYEIGRIAEYTLWLAEYADYPTFYYDFHIWQYSNEGNVPGIDTTVDLNISFDNYGGK